MSKWIEERGKSAGKGPSGADAAPAATVVILRDSEKGLETLLTRRSSKLAFHGGAWVFPGGRIDPEDYGPNHDPTAPDDLVAAARRAAAREAKEEADVDVDPAKLVHFSNWTTPEIAPKRFATWFFAGPSEGGTEVADGAETEALQWFGAEEALAARAAGEIELAPPQYVTLLALREYAAVDAALAGLAAGAILDFTPRFYMIDGEGAVCVYREDISYQDAGLLNAEGPRHRLYLRDDGWDYICD